MAEQTLTARRSTRTRINRANVRATAFQVVRADHSTSRQVVLNDEFVSLVGTSGATIILPTPFNVTNLTAFINQSNMLPQCVDAYVTNTVMTGWEVGESARGRAQDEGETAELMSFIEHANSEESMPTVMEKTIRDRENLGFGFVEIIRDRAGDLSILRHCPALYTRLCVKDPTEVLVENVIQRGRRLSYVREYRRFRRYIQIVNGQQVWFKEFGDPRRMSFHNGAFEGQDGFDPTLLATELYHFKNPSDEPYGVPRWINQLPNVIGSREAEEVNMRYFQDNTVPPMMLLVGNGRLTQQSFRELNRALNEEGLGKERQNKVMLLEAVGEGDSLDGKNSAIELKVEKLSDTRQSDGLFRGYDEANMGKIRSSFRLPPITVGMSQDVNFATASTSAFVAESQVFAPARSKIDEILNLRFVSGRMGLKLKTVKLVSRTPSITSPEMVVKTMTALNVMGALTPRTAQNIANTILQMEIAPYPEKNAEGYEDWMDKPMALGVKGAGADGGNNTHEGQSVKTAKIKEAEAEGDAGPDVPKHGDE